MKIFSIIVTYNAKRWLDRCFGSLISSSEKLDILVIDNASTDGTVEYLQKNYPDVMIFRQTENLGFGKANNIGIKYALEQGADYVFLLNQDAWIEEKTIENLLKICENPLNLRHLRANIGIVAPMQIDGSGENLDLKFQQIYLTEENTQNFLNDLYFNRLKPFYETTVVNAAAILISRDCIEKVGGFDTMLFYHYGEDWNYCQRVRYHGFQIVIAPKIKVFHDRAERQGKFSANFENAWEDIEPKIHFGNILMPDSEFDAHIKYLRKNHIIKLLKAILTLRLHKIKSIQNDHCKQMATFEIIRKSRAANKTTCY